MDGSQHPKSHRLLHQRHRAQHLGGTSLLECVRLRVHSASFRPGGIPGAPPVVNFTLVRTGGLPPPPGFQVVGHSGEPYATVCPFGGPCCPWRPVIRQGARLSSLDSGLEAFSRNPARGSIAAPAPRRTADTRDVK